MRVRETVTLAFIVDYIQSDYKKYKIVFNEFEALSKGLNEGTLSLEEKMEIIFEMCNKNLKLLELEGDAPIYDLEKIIIFRSLSSDELELEKIFIGGIFLKLGVDKLGLQTGNSQRTEETSNDSDRDFILDDQQVLVDSKIVKEHYLDKMDSYTVEDVDKIMEALERLGVIDKLCQSIKKKLLAGVYKRLSKQASIEKREKDVCSLSEEFGYEFSKKGHKVDLKERDRIYQEVEEAIDLRDMTFKEDRYVSVGEQIQWVSKLLKLNINRQMIEKLLRDIDFTNHRCTISVFSFYLSIRGKLVYFKNRYGLDEKKIKELDDYFYEMKVAYEEKKRELDDYSYEMKITYEENTGSDNEEDCQIWAKELIKETLDALSWIPKNFEYEFVKGEKIYKENRVGKPVKILGRNNIGIGKK